MRRPGAIGLSKNRDVRVQDRAELSDSGAEACASVQLDIWRKPLWQAPAVATRKFRGFTKRQLTFIFTLPVSPRLSWGLSLLGVEHSRSASLNLQTIWRGSHLSQPKIN